MKNYPVCNELGYFVLEEMIVIVNNSKLTDVVGDLPVTDKLLHTLKKSTVIQLSVLQQKCRSDFTSGSPISTFDLWLFRLFSI